MIGLLDIGSFLLLFRLEVEFSSSKAFVKFVLHIQLDLQLYPEGVTFNVTPLIGRYRFVRTASYALISNPLTQKCDYCLTSPYV